MGLFLLNQVKIIKYRSSVLYKSKKIFNNPFFLLFWNERSSNFKSYLEWEYERTKYIISQHTSFTVAISAERVNYATDATVVWYTTVTIVKNILTFNICFNDRCTLLFYKSGIESKSFNALIDTRNWRQLYYSVRNVYETFDPCDVTARSGRYLVTLSFVRRLQFVLLWVIYSLVTMDITTWTHFCALGQMSSTEVEQIIFLK